MGLHTVHTSYIPAPDTEALLWLETFGGAIMYKPECFGVPKAEVASLVALIRGFREKHEIASDPATATGPNITAKIEARNAATAAVRPLVKRIRTSPGVTPELLLELGLPVPGMERRRGPRNSSQMDADGDG